MAFSGKTPTAEKLSPCPFCEGPPEPVVVKSIRGGLVFAADIPDDGLMVEARVFCHECGARGPKEDDLVFSVEECQQAERRAVDLWQARNSRHRDLYDAGEKEGLNWYPREEG